MKLLLLFFVCCFSASAQLGNPGYLASLKSSSADTCVQRDIMTPTDDLNFLSVGSVDYTYFGSSWTPSASGDLCQFDFRMFRAAGSPTETMVLKLYTDVAGVPVSLFSNGTSDTRNVSDIPTSAGWVTFTWSGAKPAVTSGTRLFAIVQISAALGGNDIFMVNNPAGTSGQIAARGNNGTTWATFSDLQFGFKSYD